MKLISTAGGGPPVDFRTAVLTGLAPDGGLYLPPAGSLPVLTPERLNRLRGGSLHDTALAAAQLFWGDLLEPGELSAIVRDALDFPIPLVEPVPGIFVLELFHGPSLSFKDVGARFLARLLERLGGDGRCLTVLTATSGDTGSAVAEAFLGVPGTRVVILFPEGRVSKRQESQFTTLGGNVFAAAIRGSFDDCQRLAKEAFNDRVLAESVRLTSANSINIGRLLPQAIYYFHGWTLLPDPPESLVFSVPSGNFGNLTAGLIAKRMGLPVERFVAATNANDIVPRFLESGEFVPRDSIATISNAMDVGDPSNFRRMLALYSGSREAMARDVTGSSHSDDATRRCIARVYQQYGYILDPHSAVGFLALEQYRARSPGVTGIVLATAHPAKFAETVEPVIGDGIEVPERLSRRLDSPQRQVTVLDRAYRELKEFLSELSMRTDD